MASRAFAQAGTASPESPEARADAAAPKAATAAEAARPAAAPVAEPGEPAPAPAALAAPSRVKHMQAWIEYLGNAGVTMRIASGVSGFVSGALIVGFGTALFWDRGEPKSAYGLSVGRTLCWGLGAVSVFSGILSLANTTTDEDRRERWRALASVDEVTLARFEGELAAEADLARKMAFLSLGTGAGLIGGAVVSFATASTVESKSDRTAVYISGGVVAAIGVASLIVTLVSEPTNVRAYRLYREGKAPETAARNLEVTPVVGTREAGLSLSARF